MLLRSCLVIYLETYTAGRVLLCASGRVPAPARIYVRTTDFVCVLQCSCTVFCNVLCCVTCRAVMPSVMLLLQPPALRGPNGVPLMPAVVFDLR